jgi:hypothetical protein
MPDPIAPLDRAERREEARVPLQMFLDEYVSERHHRAMSANISTRGLYLHRVFAAGRRQSQFGREERFVQLEFALPGVGESIWAQGEVRYDELGIGASPSNSGAMVHGTGIQFVAMAQGHERLLRDYLLDRKRERLEVLLARVRRNRHQ